MLFYPSLNLRGASGIQLTSPASYHVDSPAQALTQEDKKLGDKSLAMSREKEKDKEMRCPQCRRQSLKRKEEGVFCGFCGYQLSPGEEVKFRLYELLR
jgi:hypothetical protein